MHQSFWPVPPYARRIHDHIIQCKRESSCLRIYLSVVSGRSVCHLNLNPQLKCVITLAADCSMVHSVTVLTRSAMGCLAAVSNPTCSDHIKNGNETGVDCGGDSCPPCKQGECLDCEIYMMYIVYDVLSSWMAGDLLRCPQCCYSVLVDYF